MDEVQKGSQKSGGLDVKAVGKHDEVQKGSQKSGGLDVKAVGKHDEVQKGSQRAEDWTLKQWESMMKSKKEVKVRRIGR